MGLAVDPESFVGFDVATSRDADPSDVIDRCQEEWSARVERAWADQLVPSAEDEATALEAAEECVRANGGDVSGSAPDAELDATIAFFDLVQEHGCRPWEAVSDRR